MFKQELLKSQFETQEHSFQQISQELHDNIGQLLSSTKLLLGITNGIANGSRYFKNSGTNSCKSIQDLRSFQNL